MQNKKVKARDPIYGKARNIILKYARANKDNKPVIFVSNDIFKRHSRGREHKLVIILHSDCTFSLRRIFCDKEGGIFSYTLSDILDVVEPQYINQMLDGITAAIYKVNSSTYDGLCTLANTIRMRYTDET